MNQFLKIAIYDVLVAVRAICFAIVVGSSVVYLMIGLFYVMGYFSNGTIEPTAQPIFGFLKYGWIFIIILGCTLWIESINTRIKKENELK